jgi:hypothetical protein
MWLRYDYSPRSRRAALDLAALIEQHIGLDDAAAALTTSTPLLRQASPSSSQPGSDPRGRRSPPLAEGANFQKPPTSVSSGGIQFPDIPDLRLDLMTGPGRNPFEAEALLNWMERNETAWRNG